MPLFLRRYLFPLGIPLLIAAFLIAGALFFVSFRQKQELREQQRQQAAVDLAQTLAGCDESRNPEACRLAEASQTAAAFDAVAFCESLTDEAAFQNCVYRVAASSQNPESCEALRASGERTDCHDAIVTLRASERQEAELCESIADLARRGRCARGATAPERVTSCTSLPVPERDACEENLLEQDQDHDGLSGGREVSLGTDPTRADTDQDGLDDGQEEALGTNPLQEDSDEDGYPDGVEVDSGHNPLGQG